MIFGSITPGTPLDLDRWLCGYDELLAHHGLADCHFVGRQRVALSRAVCTDEERRERTARQRAIEVDVFTLEALRGWASPEDTEAVAAG